MPNEETPKVTCVCGGPVRYICSTSPRKRLEGGEEHFEQFAFYGCEECGRLMINGFNLASFQLAVNGQVIYDSNIVPSAEMWPSGVTLDAEDISHCVPVIIDNNNHCTIPGITTPNVSILI